MKPGAKPKGKVVISWSPKFAYAIGLIAADGCLSIDGRHIDVTSNDRDQLENFSQALNIKTIISPKNSGRGFTSWRIQFSDVLFYRFLNTIGIMPTKSKTIGKLKIPDKYFFDFLRGVYDGDGHFYSYWDNRWENSYMYYLSFTGASQDFLSWIRDTIHRLVGVRANVVYGKKACAYQLRYAKANSLEILRKMYYNPRVLYLTRKKEKVDKALLVVDIKL